MAKIVIDKDTVTADSNLTALATQVAILGGTISYDKSSDAVTYGVTDENVGLNNAKYVVSQGGDVIEYGLWIAINDENDNVTAGIPGDTYTDDDDNVINNTWLTWLKPNNHVIEREGQKYVGTNAHTGTPLKMSELVPVFDDLVDTIPDAPGGE